MSFYKLEQSRCFLRSDIQCSFPNFTNAIYIKFNLPEQQLEYLQLRYVIFNKILMQDNDDGT